MARNESKRSRLLAIHDKLITGKSFTVKDLMDVVEHSVYQGLTPRALEKSIQDDLKQMMSEGIDGQTLPIVKVRSGRTWLFSYTDTNFELKNSVLSPEQFGILSQLIKTMDHTDLFGELAQLSNRLSQLVPKAMAKDILSRNYLFFDDRHADYEGRVYLKLLCDLIAKQTAVSILYKAFGKTEGERLVIHPYSVREYNMRFYVCGLLEGVPDKQSNLALDRIMEPPIVQNNVPFIPNPFGEDYYASVIGLTIPEESVEEEVQLLFSPSRAPYVITKPIHRTQKSGQPQPDGRYLIRLKLIVNQELESVILSFGQDVEVLAPLNLKQSIKRQLGAAIARYDLSTAMQ